jgi:hypothetical protein
MMAISTPPRARRLLASVTAAALLCLSGCAGISSDYDRSASFANFHTYIIMPRNHSEVSPVLVTRIEDAITAELGRRGFRPAADPASADFAVDFTLGYKERVDLKSYPDPYGILSWGWGGGGGWWGGPYWNPNELALDQYPDGTLSIDVFDAHLHKPIWHGWGDKPLGRKDLDRSAEPIRAAVRRILAKFPPK